MCKIVLVVVFGWTSGLLRGLIVPVTCSPEVERNTSEKVRLLLSRIRMLRHYFSPKCPATICTLGNWSNMPIIAPRSVLCHHWRQLGPYHTRRTHCIDVERKVQMKLHPCSKEMRPTPIPLVRVEFFGNWPSRMEVDWDIKLFYYFLKGCVYCSVVVEL